MDARKLMGLKYYILYCGMCLGIFIYSGMTGWNWFNSKHTETERSATSHRSGGRIYRYHK